MRSGDLEEPSMYKVLIKRHFLKDVNDDIRALVKQIRTEALNVPGYLSSETLMGADDPGRLLVITSWRSREDWLAWKQSDLRLKIDGLFEVYQAEATIYEEYLIGTPLSG